MIAAVTSKTSVAGAARVSTTTQRSTRAPCRVAVVTRASANDNQGPSTSKALSLGLCGILAAGSLAFAPPSQANLEVLGNKIEQAANSVDAKTNDPANKPRLEGLANKGSVVQDLKDNTAGAVDAVKGAASSVSNKVDNATPNNTANNLQNAGSNIVDAIKDKSSDAVDAVKGAASSVSDSFEGGARSAASDAKGVKNDIKGNVNDAASNVSNKAQEVKNDLKGAVRQGKNNVDDVANNVANSAKSTSRGLFGLGGAKKAAREGEQKLGQAKENIKDAGQKTKEQLNKATDNLNPLNLK